MSEEFDANVESFDESNLEDLVPNPNDIVATDRKIFGSAKLSRLVKTKKTQKVTRAGVRKSSRIGIRKEVSKISTVGVQSSTIVRCEKVHENQLSQPNSNTGDAMKSTDALHQPMTSLSQSNLSQRISKAVKEVSKISTVGVQSSTIARCEKVHKNQLSQANTNTGDAMIPQAVKSNDVGQMRTIGSEPFLAVQSEADLDEEDMFVDKDVSNPDLMHSLLYYSDDTPPIITLRSQKRKRTNKNWILVDEYPTYKDALKDIKDENIWSIYSSNQSATVFRCNKVKKGKEQCQSGLRLKLHETDIGVTLYTSGNQHNCDTLEHATAKLDPELREFIAHFYKKGLKRKGIEDEFIKAKKPLPAKHVLRNEIARLRRNDTGKVTITVSELHNLLIQHVTIPDDEFTGYVLDYQIDDKNEVKFNFVISCKKLLQLNLESKVCNADTTYKLIWQGYPVEVTGSTDYNKKFHPSCIGVSTTEDEDDFAFLFGALKNGTKEALDRELQPPILMADAAKAIPNGFKRVFGDEFIELMCWYHAKTAMENQISLLIPKEYQADIIRDIDSLQLSQNPAMFDKASTLFIEKWQQFTEFVEYFSQQWLHLHRNWYEGACDDLQVKAPSCNNGLEVFNRSIKDEKTLRVRLPLQQFFTLLLTWVESWARRYDAGASVYHHNVEIDLPLETLSYQWVKLKKEVRLHRSGEFYMVPAGESLTLEEWNDIFEYDTFDEYRVNVFKGWSTTVINDPNLWINGKCNCPSFLKDYICKHVIGIAIYLKLFIPRFEAKQIPIGEKRKRGRPKLAAEALIMQ